MTPRRGPRPHRSPSQPKDASKRTRPLAQHFNAEGKPKKSFPTRGTAERWVSAHPGVTVEVYLCDFCGKYHLGRP